MGSGPLAGTVRQWWTMNNLEHDQDETTEEQQPPPPVMPDESEAFRLAERAACHMLRLKAEDVVVLDLRGISDVCDFFVVGSGQASVQVKAIAREVRDGLLAVKQKPVGVEGEDRGRWALLDFVDVIVHVLKPDVRDYYQIENLWSDAQTLVVDQAHLESDGFAHRHPDLASTDADRASTKTDEKS